MRFLQRVASTAKQQQLFAILRRIDAKANGGPLIGRSSRARQDFVRLSQFPALGFAPSEVEEVRIREGLPPLLRSRSLGLYGPNGPLPLHLTEIAWDRLHNYHDESVVAFADIFHHRIQSLFYRAWADSQAVIDFDRSGQSQFTRYVGSLCGYGSQLRDASGQVADSFKFKHCGVFAKKVRSAHTLKHLLAALLGVPINVGEFVLGYLELDREQQTALGCKNSKIAGGFVLGRRVPDVMFGLEILIGPLTQAEYDQFFPNQQQHLAINDLVRNWLGEEYRWHSRLIVKGAEARKFCLGKGVRLGFDSWLGPTSALNVDLHGAVLKSH